jgi:hypothetical protein
LCNALAGVARQNPAKFNISGSSDRKKISFQFVSVCQNRAGRASLWLAL